MLMSRLALCETDHESDTGDNRGCGRCALDDAEVLREWAMMTPSVFTTNLLIRSRNLGCAGNKGRSETALLYNVYEIINTRNNLGRNVSE
jgi:hypothetical protein